MTPVERLEPTAPASVEQVLAGVRPRERAHDARPYVYVNMISTVDGRATVDGRSAGLGDDADLATMLELRTLADAVLIGPGTLRAEGYDRLVRDPARRERRRAAGQAEDPTAVVISRGLDVPWDAGLFAAPEQPVLVYTGVPGSPPAVAAPVELVQLDVATPASALADLRARGILAVLCEGGPTLNRALLSAGLVDELFVTLAPLAVGGDAEPAIVTGPPLASPAELELSHVLRHGDELLLRYRVASRDSRRAASPAH
jgi:riboflavin-specific deaminase-like protein